MLMNFLAPLFLLIGLFGTRMAFRQHRHTKGTALGGDWWLLIPLAWLPSLCMISSLFVIQY